MKRTKLLLCVLLLIGSSGLVFGQGIKISALPNYVSASDSVYLPVALGGVTYKIAAARIGVNDVFLRNDSLFKRKNASNIFVGKVNNGSGSFPNSVDSIYFFGDDSVAYRLNNGTTKYFKLPTSSFEIDSTLDLTGDIYQIILPHGLGLRPPSVAVDVTVLSGNPNDYKNFTLTWNATNVIITYSAAPIINDITFHVAINGGVVTGGGGGGGSGNWGDIAGTLADQTDLAAALASKEPAISYNFQSLTDALTTTMDCSVSINAQWTIAGNRTFSPANYITGKTYFLKVKQDATGSRHFTMPANSIAAIGASNTTTHELFLSTGANITDDISFFYDGSKFHFFITKNMQ